MTRDLGPGHREAHVGEQAARATLADVPLGVGVGRGRAAPTTSMPSSAASSVSSAPVMRGFCLVKAVRIHEDGGPEVLRYEDVEDPDRRAGRGARVTARRRPEPPRRLGPEGAPVRSEAADPRCRRRRGRRGARRRRRGLRGRRPRRRQPRDPARRSHHRHRRAHGRHVLRAQGDSGRRSSIRSTTRSRSRRAPRSRSPSRPRTACSSRRRRCGKASGCSSGASAAVSRWRRSRSRARSARARSSRRRARRSSSAPARSVPTSPSSHADDDVVQAVKDATGGNGADIVVETVGEATWERSLAAAAQEGRIVVCGATSGHSPPARLYRLWWKQLVVYGSTMGMPSDFEGAYELDPRGASAHPRRQRLPARGRREAPTSASSRAPSSARSSSRFPG